MEDFLQTCYKVFIIFFIIFPRILYIMIEFSQKGRVNFKFDLYDGYSTLNTILKQKDNKTSHIKIFKISQNGCNRDMLKM
jgi:hypothetical protein